MPVAVILRLDSHSAERVAVLARKLAGRGLGDPAARHGYPAHVTLLRYAALDEAAALPVLRRFAAAEGRWAVRLTALGLFGPAPAVLWLAPVPDARLLSMQAGLHTALPDPARVDPHCRPGAWTPHVTLAEGLSPEEVGAAIAALLPGLAPIEAWFERLELVRFPPVRMVWSAALAGPG